MIGLFRQAHLQWGSRRRTSAHSWRAPGLAKRKLRLLKKANKNAVPVRTTISCSTWKSFADKASPQTFACATAVCRGHQLPLHAVHQAPSPDPPPLAGFVQRATIKAELACFSYALSCIWLRRFTMSCTCTINLMDGTVERTVRDFCRASRASPSHFMTWMRETVAGSGSGSRRAAVCPLMYFLT